MFEWQGTNCRGGGSRRQAVLRYVGEGLHATTIYQYHKTFLIFNNPHGHIEANFLTIEICINVTNRTAINLFIDSFAQISDYSYMYLC